MRIPPAPRSPGEITLRLGDLLPRIPPRFLKPGEHDKARELRFKIDDLCEDITRGRAAVPLRQIAQLCPEIFRDELDLADEVEVQLPLQKLFEQIGPMPASNRLRAMPSSSASEAKSSDATPSLRSNEHAEPKEVPTTPAQETNGHEQTISLSLSAIFRLLPGSVAGRSECPDEHVRVALPLRLIEPQLASGTVEIPLGEVFQNLPADHPFHSGNF